MEKEKQNSDLAGLNKILFDQLNRLNNPSLIDDEKSLNDEINRSKAITSVASQVVNCAQVTINAMELVARSEANINQLPGLIGIPERK